MAEDVTEEVKSISGALYNLAAKPSRWEEAEAKREAERKSEKEDFDRRNAEHRACEDDKAESSRLTVNDFSRSASATGLLAASSNPRGMRDRISVVFSSNLPLRSSARTASNRVGSM